MPESASLSTIGDATRFIKITYPGAGNYSSLSYDGWDRNTKIVEYSAGSLVSTKQFVWSGKRKSEARDSSSTLLNQYFSYGEIISGSSCFYTHDHLGSIRELTDSSSNIQAEYNYDPYGRVAKIQGTLDSTFQYAGYYIHTPSMLSLANQRAYNSRLGRWINRDPIGETSNTNLFAYVNNSPINLRDPEGTLPMNVDVPGQGNVTIDVPPGALPGVLAAIALAASLNGLREATENISKDLAQMGKGDKCLSEYIINRAELGEAKAYEEYKCCMKDAGFDINRLEADARAIDQIRNEAEWTKMELDKQLQDLDNEVRKQFTQDLKSFFGKGGWGI